MGRTHLRNVAAIPNARVVVVADPDPRPPRRGRELWPVRSAPSADPLEAIHDPEVDAVVIVTPTATHAALIEAALRAGKAVWSEKPIAQDVADTRADRRPLARDRHPGPARLHAPLRPGLRAGEGS